MVGHVDPHKRRNDPDEDENSRGDTNNTSEERLEMAGLSPGRRKRGRPKQRWLLTVSTET